MQGADAEADTNRVTTINLIRPAEMQPIEVEDAVIIDSDGDLIEEDYEG